MSFQSILDSIREEARSERDKGTKFEELIRRYLLTDPVYATRFEWVVMWNDFFANEITLLAYYIANVNIENTYQRITGSTVYTPFENIVLTDTFNIEEICRNFSTQLRLDQLDYFGKNKARIKKQYDMPITVIMGNPPYGANQKSANDNAKKRRYQAGIDKRIKETYLADQMFTDGHGNVNSVYDNYIRAFRWASDRIGNNNGIIAYVTPNGWMTSAAFEGFRKCVESEFSKIYIFNLRGDVAGIFKFEGDNIFISQSSRGCRTGIDITLLVKHKDYSGSAQIFYQDIMNYNSMNRVSQKLSKIAELHSFIDMLNSNELKTLSPDKNGDWLVKRNDVFGRLIPIAGDTHKKFDKCIEKTIFVGYSQGYQTCRDIWSVNYSNNNLSKSIISLIEEYNHQTSQREMIFDPKKISWSSDLKIKYQRKIAINYNQQAIQTTLYRPFVKQYMYRDYSGNLGFRFQQHRLFPNGIDDNLAICVPNSGDKKQFSCLITHDCVDLHLIGVSQCFPLYWYDVFVESSNPNQRTLTDITPSEPIRHDGISDYALKEARKKYGNGISREDIFYYIYGYLHSPEYRNTFSDDLKLSLPRIGFVDSYDDFKAFSDAGRKLADLHLNYESAPMYPDVGIIGGRTIDQCLSDPERLRVRKMKLDEKNRTLAYNEYVTITDIPEDAFRYIVNGRSALGWLVDQYQYSVDKESGIVNDPNEYAGPEYIFKLVLSVITVSVETMKIVDSLPKLNFGEES